MEKRFAAIAFAVAGALFELVAFIPVFRGEGINVVFLALGVVFLSLSAVFGMKRDDAGS
ncbi:MAG TPA: hypothetical protein VHG09_14890 [Longimicrobiales bacterium]|nr:hypothetical protein [Longimicrobiales bacterium]